MIKLLTPNPAEFTPEYNAWLESIPNYVRALVFVIKRFYRPEWGADWRSHFSVDIINGAPGHELKYEGRRLVGSYLRVGREENGAWRTYKLRQDFVAADKVQMEDDITASVVVPARRLVGLPGEYDGHPEPQARGELRVPALPAARRRDPSRPRPADRGGHGGARALLLQLRAAHPGGRAAHRRGRGAARRLHAADARARGPKRRAAPTAGTRSARPSRGWSTASRPRTRATSRCGRTWRARATATSPRWARGSTAGCRCTRRCCSR